MDNKAPLVMTHDGDFHADEIVGVSLLKWVFGEIHIERTRDPERLKSADFLLDVGGHFDPKKRYFDHHQKEYTGHLASAGMILDWLVEEKKLDSKFAVYLNNSFILGVDQQDTGQYIPQPGICSFTDIIRSFNHFVFQESKETQLTAFNQAIEFTLGYIGRLQTWFIHNAKYHKKFMETLLLREKMPQRLLVLDENIPWKEFILEETTCSDILFVLFPQNEEKWILHTVPESKKNLYSNRLKLPEAWAGLLEGNFQKMCGIPEAIFCHKQRFIAGFKTKEGALKAALLALNHSHSETF